MGGTRRGRAPQGVEGRGEAVMSRKRYGLTESRILKSIKQGRGLGTVSSYIPWFLVSNLSSKGRSHRIYTLSAGYQPPEFIRGEGIPDDNFLHRPLVKGMILLKSLGFPTCI